MAAGEVVGLESGSILSANEWEREERETLLLLTTDGIGGGGRCFSFFRECKGGMDDEGEYADAAAFSTTLR